MELAEITRLIEEGKVEYVKIGAADIEGVYRGKRVAARHFPELPGGRLCAVRRALWLGHRRSRLTQLEVQQLGTRLCRHRHETGSRPRLPSSRGKTTSPPPSATCGASMESASRSRRATSCSGSSTEHAPWVLSRLPPPNWNFASSARPGELARQGLRTATDAAQSRLQLLLDQSIERGRSPAGAYRTHDARSRHRDRGLQPRAWTRHVRDEHALRRRRHLRRQNHALQERASRRFATSWD